MKILLVADCELRELWDYWDTAGKKRTEGVELILSAGDIKPEYLEFLVTMLNVPCLYVRGNHDGMYDEKPPMGCIDIDGKVFELKSDNRMIRIAGLGGSMRYRKSEDMYTEREMRNRVRKLLRRIRLGIVTGRDERSCRSSELSEQARAMGINPFTKRRRTATAADDLQRNAEHEAAANTNTAGRQKAPGDEIPAASDRGPVDIFLTHAPCFGHGDLEDLPHTGFKCFNRFHELVRPAYHCYGHVHREYNVLMPKETEHPAGAHLINVGGMYILDT